MRWRWLLAGCALGAVHAAFAQQIVNQVGLISSAAVSAQAVPTAQTFTITAAGTYNVTLTDLASPAALASLSLAVASPTALAVQLSAPGSTKSQSVTLQPGVYTEQVLATAATGSLGGSFSVQVTAPGGAAVPVTPAGGSGTTNAFVGAVSAPSSSVAGQTVLQTSFTVSDPGNYQVTLTDLAFPVALAAQPFDVAIWNQANPGVLLLHQTGVGAGTITVPSALTAGVYELIVIAQAASPALAGLYSVQVAGGASGTSVALSVSEPVGGLPPPIEFTVPAGNLSLKLQDLTTPVALSGLSALLVQGSTVLATMPGSGSYPVSNLATGDALLFVHAQADATAGEGAWALSAISGSQTLLDIAQTVTDDTHFGYVFSTNVPAGGAQVQLQINDYGVPAALSVLSVSAEQGAELIGTTALSTGASVTLNPVPDAGVLNLVAFATPSASGSGLFGVQLTSATSQLLQMTQAVGPSFHAQTVTIPGAGNYTVQLTDLGFPASFKQLSLIVTSGTQRAGEIDGGGTFTFDAQPGQYTLNVLAQTGNTSDGNAANYGLYGVQMNAAEPQSSGSGSGSSGTTGSSGGAGALSLGDLSVLLMVLLWQWHRSDAPPRRLQR